MESEKLHYLRKIRLFDILDRDEILFIDQYSAMRRLGKGKPLYFQGISEGRIYILKKGTIKFTKLTPEGREFIVDIAGDGTVFGDITFLKTQERDDMAEALEDSLLCILNRKDFDALLTKRPDLTERLLKTAELRRKKIEEKLVRFLYFTVEQRIASVLLELMEDFGIPSEKSHLINLKLTHRDIASMVASTRETVTCTLSRLRKSGIIDFQERQIIIKDPLQLTKLLED